MVKVECEKLNFRSIPILPLRNLWPLEINIETDIHIHGNNRWKLMVKKWLLQETNKSLNIFICHFIHVKNYSLSWIIACYNLLQLHFDIFTFMFKRYTKHLPQYRNYKCLPLENSVAMHGFLKKLKLRNSGYAITLIKFLNVKKH